MGRWLLVWMQFSRLSRNVTATNGWVVVNNRVFILNNLAVKKCARKWLHKAPQERRNVWTFLSHCFNCPWKLFRKTQLVMTFLVRLCQEKNGIVFSAEKNNALSESPNDFLSQTNDRDFALCFFSPPEIKTIENPSRERKFSLSFFSSLTNVPFFLCRNPWTGPRQ